MKFMENKNKHEIAIRANAHTNRKCINGYSIG